MSQTSLVADVLAELRGHLLGQNYCGPRQRDEILNAAMTPLKEAPPEAGVEFVLTGLRIVREEPSTWFAHSLVYGVANVLRRKLAFTEDQLLEIIKLVSVPHREFPFKGILNAVECSGVRLPWPKH